MADTSSHLGRICVRRYAAGKAFVCTHGAPEFAGAAERALQRSLVIEARVDAHRFRTLLRAEGVPDATIEEYLDHAVVDDEAWLQDVYPS
jgi:hypothetical protein